MPSYVIPPAGVSAASFFSPTTFVDPARPPGVLADSIDPITGEITSLFTAPHPVDAAIAWQFSHRRGAGAAVTESGHGFASIKKNDASAANAIKAEAQRIMRPFVEGNDASVAKLEVEGGEAAGDLGAVFLQYVNLRTRRDVRIEVGA